MEALSKRQYVGLAVLTGLIVASEWMAVDISIGAHRRIRSSMAFLPLLTCAILFPSPAALLAASAASTVTQLTIKSRALWKVLGNGSLAVLALGVGLMVFESLGGRPNDAALDVSLTAFFGLATAFFVTDTLIVSGFYAVRTEQPFHIVFRRVVGPSAINIIYGLLASPVAIFAAMLYSQLYIGGLVLITLPLMLFRYSYISKIQLQQSNRDLLKVLIKTIETRDPYTSGHSLRVSILARLIAQDLGCSPRMVDKIETVGLLHDIGKIDSVYSDIIQKRSSLTIEEHNVIKTHSVRGAELLQSLTSLPDDVIRGVRHHHERYDGMGYPEGIAGEDIPIASRIIMICDSIDAMLSDRPYRSALSLPEVENELRRCAGTQFDPKIVNVVLRRRTLERAMSLIHGDVNEINLESTPA